LLLPDDGGRPPEHVEVNVKYMIVLYVLYISKRLVLYY